MAVTVVAASTLDDERLAALFTAVYAGYWHPLALDAAGLRRMVETYDLDLDASVVALAEGESIAVALLGLRHDAGWVGGMGVLPEHRGRGHGEHVTRALLERALERGVSRVRLEVLVQNAPAERIYRRVGFAPHREVGVWRLETPPEAMAADDADVDDVLAGAIDDDAPWQRHPATVRAIATLGGPLAAVRCPGGSAVFTPGDPHWSLLAVDARTSDAAAALLRAPFDRGAASLILLNLPVEHALAPAVAAAGGSELARQRELAWHASGDAR